MPGKDFYESRKYPPTMAAAVVTGAGRGLGRAIASTLTARGFIVHLTDIEEALATEAAAEIGRGAFGSALDVRDEAACHSVAATTVQMAGSLDVWVNNAGVLITGTAWEQDAEARRLMIEVNTIGTMNGTVAALQPMIAARRGHVINVVSLAGLVAAPGEVAYAASKHGAIAFTLGTQLTCAAPGSGTSTSPPSARTGSGRRCSPTSSTTRLPRAPSPASCKPRSRWQPRSADCSTARGR